MRKTMAVFAVLMPEAYCVCRSGVICCIWGIDCTNLIGPSGQICDTAEFAIVRRSTLALGWIWCFASLSHPSLFLLGCSRGGGLALLSSIFFYIHLHFIFSWLAVSSAPLPLSLQNSLRRLPSFLRSTRLTLPRYLVAIGLEYTSCLSYLFYKGSWILHYESNSVSFVPRLRCFVAAMPPLSGPEAWQ